MDGFERKLSEVSLLARNIGFSNIYLVTFDKMLLIHLK